MLYLNLQLFIRFYTNFCYGNCTTFLQTRGTILQSVHKDSNQCICCLFKLQQLLYTQRA